MKRRTLLAFIGFFSLGGTTLAARRLVAFVRGPDEREHITRSIAAIADIMFPGDGTPGAAALDVHRRVLAMPELQDQIANGVSWLDQHAASQGVSSFLALDEAGQLAALDAAFASHDDGIQPFVLTLRYHLGTAYYSAPAVKSAFAYTGPPQPDGFPDFQQRPA
jgi:hypothetical protein